MKIHGELIYIQVLNK